MTSDCGISFQRVLLASVRLGVSADYVDYASKETERRSASGGGVVVLVHVGFPGLKDA